MSQKNTGICKLCQKEAELRNSHILPEFGFRKMCGNKTQPHGRIISYHPDAQYNETTYPSKNGLREKLFCNNCEQKLGIWEEYASGILDKMENQVLASDVYEHDSKVNYQKFKLFQLSLIWRMSISKNEMFKMIDIGQKHENNIREMLDNGNPGKKYNYGCILTRLINSTVQTMPIETQKKSRLGNHWTYKIGFMGYFWIYIMSSHLTNKDDPHNLILDPNGTLRIYVTNKTVESYIEKKATEPKMKKVILDNMEREALRE